MTKQEIQALINAKIAGQGNQVDQGGALATILSEILGTAAMGGEVLEVSDAIADDQTYTPEQFIETMGITADDLERMKKGEIPTLRIKYTGADYYVHLAACIWAPAGGTLLYGGHSVEAIGVGFELCINHSSIDGIVTQWIEL